MNDILNKIKQFSFFDTFKHASTYFSGTVLVQALGLVSLPVFTAYLSADEYGVVNIFTSYFTVITVLLTLNVNTAIPRYYFEHEEDDFDSFLGTIVLLGTLFFVLTSFCMFFFREAIASYINLPSHLIKWLLLMSYMVFIYAMYNQVLVVMKRSKEYVSIQTFWQYTKFGLTFLGLVYLTNVFYTEGGQESSYTFMGKIIGESIATVVVVLYAFRQVYKVLSFKKISLKYVKYTLWYAIPLIPATLSNYILTYFDQWYINSSLGNADAGKYAFAYKIAIIYMGLGIALLNGARPDYYNYMNQEQYKKVNQQVISMTKFLVLGGGFLILFAVDLGTLLSFRDDFLAALPIAPIIIGAYVFHGVSLFVNRGIFYTKKNIYLAIIVLISGLINILLNSYYIPIYGYQAAAYTTLVSYFLMMMMSLGITTYILKLPPLPLGRILKYIVFLAAIIALNYTLGEPNIGLDWKYILFKLFLFGTLAILLFYDKISFLLSASNKPEDILDN